MMKILVAGATGTQGGAVIEHLLSGEYGEYEVYGLTRNNQSERAQELEDLGVHIVTGDLTDEDRMRELCAGMDGVFCVTTPFEMGPEYEVQQGVSMATAAAAEDVSHFMFTSVGGADADSGIPHLESKWAIEQHVHEMDVDWTILRPVYFMQNFMWNAEEIGDGYLSMPLDEDVELAMVHAHDIGQAAAMAFAEPEAYVGETINLVGDSLTLEEMAGTISEAMG
ncbi:MAG: NmrA/HSCARG family protein, partial [Halobacteriales archaeon]|nr:NmrA/HSCARG family protein [Halobacteriales archaeon]